MNKFEFKNYFYVFKFSFYWKINYFWLKIPVDVNVLNFINNFNIPCRDPALTRMISTTLSNSRSMTWTHEQYLFMFEEQAGSRFLSLHIVSYN